MNWGGYQAQSRGGAVLEGSASSLPSQPNDPNTRDYRWAPGRPYRLTISPGALPGWWRGTVEDLERGEQTVIRELDGGGDRLTSPMVWIESFAPCDAASVTALWRDLHLASPAGDWEEVTAVSVNYQAYAAGGCTNTNATSGSDHFAQTTNTARRNPTGTTLRLAP